MRLLRGMVKNCMPCLWEYLIYQSTLNFKKIFRKLKRLVFYPLTFPNTVTADMLKKTQLELCSAMYRVKDVPIAMQLNHIVTNSW